MSKKSVVIPDACRVTKSTDAAQVILTFEIPLVGESPGDPASKQAFAIPPYDAIVLGRQLQDRSVQLLLKLAGYEVPPDISPENEEPPRLDS